MINALQMDFIMQDAVYIGQQYLCTVVALKRCLHSNIT